jgi:hypothetical protein
MAKKSKPKPVQWEVIRLGAQGVLLGVVYAQGEATARKAAIEQLRSSRNSNGRY